MSKENNDKPINEHLLREMRDDLRRLIVRYCAPKERGRQKLFLHNEEEIEFTEHKPSEIEVFYGLIKDHLKSVVHHIKDHLIEDHLRSVVHLKSVNQRLEEVDK